MTGDVSINPGVYMGIYLGFMFDPDDRDITKHVVSRCRAGARY